MTTIFREFPEINDLFSWPSLIHTWFFFTTTIRQLLVRGEKYSWQKGSCELVYSRGFWGWFFLGGGDYSLAKIPYFAWVLWPFGIKLWEYEISHTFFTISYRSQLSDKYNKSDFLKSAKINASYELTDIYFSFKNWCSVLLYSRSVKHNCCSSEQWSRLFFLSMYK